MLAIIAMALAAPVQVTQTGRLLDAAGVPLNGPQSLVVDMVSTGGGVAYTETFTPDIGDGYFSVVLGQGGGLDDSVFAQDLSVRVSVGGTVLSSVPLTSVPRAARATVADRATTADSATTAGFATTAGTASGVPASGGPPALCSSAAQQGLTYFDSTAQRFYGCFGTRGWQPLLAEPDAGACWDTNFNSTCDGAEDRTGDGQCTVLDCYTNPQMGANLDLYWGALHAAAAAACRGSTPSGGTGCCGNAVRVRNNASGQSCSTICSSHGQVCDAEISIWGRPGQATANGEAVGNFYNYSCSGTGNGGSEASVANEAVLTTGYWGFCCCRT